METNKWIKNWSHEQSPTLKTNRRETTIPADILACCFQFIWISRSKMSYFTLASDTTIFGQLRVFRWKNRRHQLLIPLATLTTQHYPRQTKLPSLLGVILSLNGNSVDPHSLFHFWKGLFFAFEIFLCWQSLVWHTDFMDTTHGYRQVNFVPFSFSPTFRAYGSYSPTQIGLYRFSHFF